MVEKYVHDFRDFMAFLNGQPITKGAVTVWRVERVFGGYLCPDCGQFHAGGGQRLFSLYGPAKAVRQAAESTAPPFSR